MTGPTTSIGDYLRGYVVGYWQAWDFATSAEGRNEADGGPVRACDECSDDESRADCLACGRTGWVEEDREIASADGDADATSAAASTTGRSAPAGHPKGPRPVVDSAAEALPAVRQPALAGEEKAEVEGDLAALHYHAGTVDALHRMGRLLKGLGYPEAAVICRNAALIWGTPEDREVRS